MKSPLHILHLEDDPNDAALVQSTLAADGITCATTRVQNRDDFVAALERGGIDLILTDFKLPAFDGLSALKIAHDGWPDLPVIMVSGTLGEEQAVDSLKNGATDYVLKTCLLRLVSAVRRAMQGVAENDKRKRSEEALRESERRFQTLAEISPVGIFWTDAQGRTTNTNQRWCQITGLSAAEALGDGWLRAVHPEDREKLVQTWQAATQAQGDSKADYRFVHSDGTICWVMGQAIPEKDHAGCVLGYVGTITDITEHKQVEGKLAWERNLMRTLIDNLPDAIYAKDTNGRKTMVNPADLKNLNYQTEAEAIGKRDFDFFPKDEAEKFWADDQRVLRGQPVLNREENFIDKEGRKHWLLTSKLPLRDPAGKITGLVGIGHDITERKQAEESNARLAMAVEQAGETIVITDIHGTILYANPAFETTSGYTRAEALGQNPRVLKSGKHDAEFYRRMWDVLKRGEAWSGHFINRRKDGILYEEEATISPVRDATGAIVNYVAVKRDVTREAQLEEQIRQAQKMEAIGQLASGVAHDFNNILGVIMGYESMIAADLDPDSPLLQYVEEIRHASERAVGLTRQLLVFSRKETVQPVVLDLNQAVKDLAKMLQRLIGENVEITILPAEQIGRIKADPGHIGQLLMNLAVNARDAMPNGGKLTIATRNVTLDENDSPRGASGGTSPGPVHPVSLPAFTDGAGSSAPQGKRTHPGATPGDYVMLSVSDTGTGMTPEVKARIFEALFTTKPAGKGTGLGLATCQTIVQLSGGHIDVDSQVGKGTTFKIYFPRVDKPLADAARPNQTGQLPRGTETLLLVEDEPTLRHLSARVLAAQGYNVLRANNGQDALQVVGQHKGAPIRLVVTDVIMPRMGGKIMAEWLKTTHPDLKVLFTSGYTDDVIFQHGVLNPGVAFLPKPYSQGILVRKVRELLDAAPETAPA